MHQTPAAHHLRREVPFLAAVGGAAGRAIWTDRVRLRGAGDVEALFDLSGLGHVEAEGREAGRPGPGGADLQKVAARDLWHPIPPTGTACRRLKVRVPTQVR